MKQYYQILEDTNCISISGGFQELGERILLWLLKKIAPGGII